MLAGVSRIVRGKRLAAPAPVSSGRAAVTTIVGDGGVAA